MKRLSGAHFDSKQNRPQKVFILTEEERWITEASGRGTTSKRPPPEIGNIVVENWRYFPGVST